MAWGPWLILAAVFVVVAVISAARGNSRRRGVVADRLRGMSFRSEPLLVNAAEKSAWALLNRTDLGHALVFAKVRLEDVVLAHAQDGITQSAARGHIKSRHIDSLPTDEAFQPLLAVEVDGGSHGSERTATADEMKDQILASARVPLVRLRVGADWSAALAEWSGEHADKASARTEEGNPHAGSCH